MKEKRNVKENNRMGGFEELGKKLDELSGKVRSEAWEGAEKAGGEIRDWKERLENLGERIKKTTQEGIQRFTLEAKEMIHAPGLRSEIREARQEIESLLRELGEKTYQLHLEKKIGNVELKKLGGKITKLKIEVKEKDIQRLRERQRVRKTTQ